MMIHDDYYDIHYGIEYIKVKEIYAGAGIGNQRIELGEIELKPWHNKVTSHERLKASYYILQEFWKDGD